MARPAQKKIKSDSKKIQCPLKATSAGHRHSASAVIAALRRARPPDNEHKQGD
jgi:hypothetical protein